MSRTVTVDVMPAVVNYAPDEGAVELREVAVPTIGEEDVLLRVGAVGVCGSDVHQYLGRQSWRVNHPVILGHEFAGTIERAGERVRSFQVGDRVVSETAAIIDRDSPLTRSGRYNLDPGRSGFGAGVDGAMTTFVRVPERCLHHVPDGLSLERAALTEPCCVAYNAVCVNSVIRPGDSVAVVGPGPIGLLCVLMAALSGARPLIVVGLAQDRARLETARALGATDVVVIGDDDEATHESLRTRDGYGVDLVVDAAGVSGTLQLALDVVRPGGQVTKVGWGPQPYGRSLDPLVAKNVTLRGSFSHTWEIWERVLGMLSSGQVGLDHILSRVAPLSDWQACFEEMHDGTIVKAVLMPDPRDVGTAKSASEVYRKDSPVPMHTAVQPTTGEHQSSGDRFAHVESTPHLQSP
jgi:alcohol dehydrogenase/L-iditol 2-dehydrogenase